MQVLFARHRTYVYRWLFRFVGNKGGPAGDYEFRGLGRTHCAACFEKLFSPEQQGLEGTAEEH
jgi:hypothetical protein